VNTEDLSGPDFSSPLSQPNAAAVAAFRRPEHQLSPLTDPAIAHGLHDAGQAQRFVDRFGARFRFDHVRRVFLRWNAHHWEVDRDGEPMRCAIELARDLYLDAGFESNLKAREAIAKFSIHQQSRRKVEDVLGLAKVLPPITDTGADWNIDPFVLATPWGVVDLRNGHSRDGRPEDRITLCTNAKHDPTAGCPRWELFLLQTFVDPALVAYIQRAIGYSATADMREQVIFLLVGAGANGKSTFLEAIAHVLGEYSYAAPFQTFEATQRSEIGADVAALAGRRFVRSSETNTRSRFNEARLKAMSGGDKLNARHLYGNPFEFHPVAKIWLSVNHKPSVSDDSFGFWRRIHTIPFSQTFAGSADDKGLKDTLRSEASGILNWIVAGCGAWLHGGLQPPNAVMAATDAYQRENDPLADFLDDCCVFVSGATTAAAALYGSYLGWCDRQGIRERLSRKRLGTLLGGKFEGRHTENGKVYVGVGLRADG